MRATAIEFRLRMLINAIIIVLGLASPWIELWGVGRRITTLEWLATEVSRLGLLSFAVATPAVLVAASLIAAIAVILRVCGAAYLGPRIVQSGDMKADAVMADGPYRYVRNPLYLGVWFMVAALAFLMPPTGALFAMVFITLFQLRLILGEEAFLTAKIGEPYLAYLRAVPRLIPRLRTALPPSGAKPRWILSLLTELTPIGVFVALSAASWTYNSRLMFRVILVFFGVSLVVRALIPGSTVSSDATE
jgi:protein-S-isoprenylcysteine O-methyltransferase Ste14